jgi:hypothetical protein
MNNGNKERKTRRKNKARTWESIKEMRKKNGVQERDKNEEIKIREESGGELSLAFGLTTLALAQII